MRDKHAHRQQLGHFPMARRIGSRPRLYGQSKRIDFEVFQAMTPKLPIADETIKYNIPNPRTSILYTEPSCAPLESASSAPPINPELAAPTKAQSDTARYSRVRDKIDIVPQASFIRTPQPENGLKMHFQMANFY
jgi:hypothetical protein